MPPPIIPFFYATLFYGELVKSVTLSPMSNKDVERREILIRKVSRKNEKQDVSAQLTKE
jgi:hypothetical protein